MSKKKTEDGFINCFLCDEKIYEDDDCCYNCGFPIYSDETKKYKLYIVACKIEDDTAKKEVIKILKSIYNYRQNMVKANHLIMQWGEYEQKDEDLENDAIDLIVDFFRRENNIPFNMNFMEATKRTEIIENAIENANIFKHVILETIGSVKKSIDELSDYDKVVYVFGSDIERKYFKTLYGLIKSFSEKAFKYVAFVNFAFYEAFSYTDKGLMEQVGSLLDDYFKICNKILDVIDATYENDNDEFTCGDCGKLVDEDDTECPHCGAKFE